VIYIKAGVTGDQGYMMTTSALTVLMIISLGCMVGTATGLAIGFALKKQQSEWSAMSRSEKTTNIALVIVCSVLCCAGLAWYSLQAPPV
jgi:cytochrome bd-type quinol oxidase subunit 1